MELEEIMLVIRSCCTESQLRSLLPGQNLGRDPYRRAAELLLEGDESADGISTQLDRSSAAQREKIRQLSLADLRKSLVIEFMEPGRSLGLVVWALLRDGRVGAAHLASQIYRTFADEAPRESPKPRRVPPAEARGTGKVGSEGPSVGRSSADSEWEIPEDLVSEEESIGIGEDFPESFAETDEEFGSDEDGIDDLDEVFGAVVKEIKAEAMANGAEEMHFDFGEDLEEEESVALADQEALTGILSETEEDLVPPDIGDLEEILEESVEPSDDFAVESAFSGGAFEETIEVPDADEIGSILDETLDLGSGDSLGIPDLDELTDILEEELPMDEEEIFEPGAELPPVFEEEEEEEEIVDLSDLEPVEVEEQEPAPVGRQYITMAGIDVPIESLHRACCGVFGEPVELVTDPELLAQDKIGVVGKHCGVKILHGPSWSIEAQLAPEDRLDRPVNLSPVGAEEALSKVYGEQIKIIPDPGLLGQGIIPIVGRQTGIVILKNEGARMGLPPWVDEETAGRIKAAVSAAGDTVSGKDVTDLQDQVRNLLAMSADYEARLTAIEKEMESIEYVPVTEEKEIESEPEPEMEIEEIPEEIAEEIEETSEIAEEEEPILEGLAEEEEEPAEEDDLGLDLDALDGLTELGVEEEEIELPMEEIVEEEVEEESMEDEGGDDLDLDFINEIEKAVNQEDEEEVKKIFSGETILILGGEEQYRDEYGRIVDELGGNCEWYQSLAEMSESEIAEVVDRSDLILTLSDAITDPGILQATNYAQENNKRCFAHHSANPASVSKQLVKLVDEGKV